MQDVVSQILDENYGYETGTLDFSCAKMEFCVDSGCVYEGSFTVMSPGGQLTTGYVIASDLRMECLTKRFTGSREEIHFCFHAEQLEEGETRNGAFQIISNQGEYSLPFVVSVSRPQIPSSIGNLKNLFHFANLAKDNWKEAAALFTKPEFLNLFRGNDKQYLDLYRGLSVYPGNEQNMEEFLISIHKKVRMEYLLQEMALTMDNPMGIAETTLTIVRNGWGYTYLRIEVEGDFAFTEKEMLTEDDFLGHYCRLPIYVDSSFLTEGKNTAHIRLTNPHMELLGEALTISLTVNKEENEEGHGKQWHSHSLRQEEKHILARLMELYQSMRLHKIGTATWLHEAGILVERMRTLDEQDCEAKLFAAQLLVTEERYNEAKWLLEHTERILREDEGNRYRPLWAYYLYLTTLVHTEEAYVLSVAQEVEQIYRQDPNQWRVGWLLLFLSKEYHRSPIHKWGFIETQVNRGCSSPVILIEALILLNANPTLLRKLGAYELQVVLYGIRQGALSMEVLEQLLYLAGKVKEFDQKLYEILKSCYRKVNDIRFLREICVLLIKGGRSGTKYFAWFRLGVENELRITKLYEYYMDSLPIPPLNSTYIIDRSSQHLLPRTVQMYFSYQSNLDPAHSAFLYALVYQQRREFPELYANYQSRIMHFVEEQIVKAPFKGNGIIDPYLNYLYKELLEPSMISEAAADSLAVLCFMHRVRVTYKTGTKRSLCKVIVCRPGVLTPKEYPMERGEAWVPLYDKDSSILLEDNEGNRYGMSISCKWEDMSLPLRFGEAAAPLVEKNREFNLYLYEHFQNPELWVSWMVDKFKILSGLKALTLPIRRELILKVMSYYYEKDDFRSLSAYLEGISPEDLTDKERREALRYMLLCERTDLAQEWVYAYGPEFADEKALLWLCSDRITQIDFVRNKMVMNMALSVFRQEKYDGNILRYLSLYFQGTLGEMTALWKAARSFDVECYKLSERILLQTLYTHTEAADKVEVLQYYVTQSAKPGVEDAFLTRCAYDYFVREQDVDAYVFREIIHMEQCQEPINKICKLAFLKFAAENPFELYEGEVNAAHPAYEMTGNYLREMMEEGIHLSFYHNLKAFSSLLYPIQDKTILEYRTRSNNPVKLHYMLCREDGESGEYQDVEMQRILGGLFFQEFILFFGESIQYHVVELKDGEEILMDSGTLLKGEDAEHDPQNSDNGSYQGDKFEFINEMVISKSLHDTDMLERLAEEFHWKEYLGERLFLPM